MDQPRPVDRGERYRLLTQIHEGMTVYDNKNEKVGRVDKVYLGTESQSDELEPEATPQPYRPNEGTITEAIANVFDPDEMPEPVAQRLLHSGFVRIDGAGLTAADRYAVPAQLTAVSDDEVHLSVSRQELMADRW